MPPLPAAGARFHEPGSNCTEPGGHQSGGPNEIWEFGADTEVLLTASIAFRETLRSYIAELAVNASATGAPPMRPLFYDFPKDAAAWHVDDQYMFGPKYLVAPVTQLGTVLVFRQDFPPEDDIGSHNCALEASRRAT
jgi:alpha-D-xyloside xylohydrolase